MYVILSKKTIGGNRLKRIIFLSIMIVITLLMPSNITASDSNISVWDGKTVDGDWGNNYATTDTFQIDSADDFMKFRNMVISGSNFIRKTVNLNIDIDLNNNNLRYGIGMQTGTSWTEGTDVFSFRGTFNGNGHIIKNILMDQTKTDSCLGTENKTLSIGLFSTRGGCTLSRFGVENIHIVLPLEAPTNLTYYGGICGFSDSTIIKLCYAKNVSFSGGWNGAVYGAYIGGMIGDKITSSLQSCYVSGVDFTGLSGDSEFLSKTKRAGIALLERDYVSASTCYGINISDIGSGTGAFTDSISVLNGSNTSVTNIYSDDDFEMILTDLSGTLGNDFTDMSQRNLWPLLSWQTIGPAFSYDSITFYKDYGTSGQSSIKSISESDGIITVDIAGVLNNTGNDVKDAVVCVYFLDNQSLVKMNYEFVQLNKSEKRTEDIIVSLDLSGKEISDDGVVQVIMYKGINQVIPLFTANQIKK